MQKKIIALAITAALTVPALAYAEVTVYGQANLSIDISDGGEAINSSSANQMKSYGARYGLKGTDALDGGITLDWNLEGGVNMDDGVARTPNQVFDRESNIGLSSDMGTVRLGLQASPYKAMSRKLDLFGDSAADTRSAMTARDLGSGHDDSATNAISYKTPSMGGFTAVVATRFGNEGQVEPQTENAALGFAGMYEQGPIFAMVAIDNGENGVAGAGNVEASAFKVGGSYTMDAIQVNAVFENVSDTGGTVETKSTNMYLGAKYNLSSTSAVKVAYTGLGEQKVGGTGRDNGLTQLSVGYDHGMSKATTVYALYTAISADLAGVNEPSIISFGLKHKF